MNPRLRSALARRALTVPSVALGSAVLSATAAAWIPGAAMVDLARRIRGTPLLRALSVAWAWTTLESLGVGASGALWLAGRSNDRASHYALQRWWAARLVDSLRWFANLRIEVDGMEQLAPGPVVMCARHASLADALLPAWLLGQVGMRPHYVLREDLLLDPCLDIVGNRLPNHFIDREPESSNGELAALGAMASRIGARDAAVIFPEGMVVTAARRNRAIERVALQDPQRGARVRRLRSLAPVRGGGTMALLAGAPDADLVIVTHSGLESLQGIGDAPAALPLTEPVRVRIRRVARAAVPRPEHFLRWFDDQWEQADQASAGDHSGGSMASR